MKQQAEPGSFDPRETWERHLQDLVRLPPGASLRDETMEYAREMIAKAAT